MSACSACEGTDFVTPTPREPGERNRTLVAWSAGATRWTSGGRPPAWARLGIRLRFRAAGAVSHGSVWADRAACGWPMSPRHSCSDATGRPRRRTLPLATRERSVPGSGDARVVAWSRGRLGRSRRALSERLPSLPRTRFRWLGCSKRSEGALWGGRALLAVVLVCLMGALAVEGYLDRALLERRW